MRTRSLMRASAAVLLPVLLSLTTMSPSWSQPKPAAPATPQPAQIDRNGVLILVRSTLLAVQAANETGNYTVLRDMSAPGFRDANNAARLAEIFANQRNQKLDLSGVAVLEPQLTLLPQIEPGGMMRMAGYFPSAPAQINFELIYAPVDGRWRPYGIAVNVASTSPVAPPGGTAPPPSRSSDAKRP